MADESYPLSSTTTVHAADPSRESISPSTSNAPPAGFAIRHAATFSQPSPLRRRLNGNNPPPPTNNGPFTNLRRRSSTYSDYLETSADELLNPSKSNTKEDQKSPFVYIPLTLALLPAVAGVFFENGAAFFTDLILLSLAAVFLHWSVTQPWDWYHSAQQVRIVQDDILSGSVFDSDSDPDSAPGPATTIPEDLSDEQEEKEPEANVQNAPAAGGSRWEARQRAAVKELYVHEMMALAWCFAFPVLGAYLLHTIRGQLSRPSEGLVSDYNLTIFLCAAEVRPVSHLIRMLQQRTLYVQAIVARNPHAQKTVTHEQIQSLCARLDELESREISKESSMGNIAQAEVPQKLIESSVGREFRKTIQPELDALNRAMRRYEKKLTLLASQTDNRLEYVEYRLNDAIALAAVAAKNSHSQWGLVGWVAGKTVNVAMLPLQAVTAVLTFPFRTASTLYRWKGQQTPEKAQRPVRNGKSSAQGRAGSDRVPTRVSRK
ncbi:hypothetical protein SAMD00023353_3601010 [Rosellinia necatrix]|uniref:Uncharacterized protein n=1 Tax=Rosellinia necatrix TaxID=77044 RepID=A0A1W2TN66_ROSNE|nr:hypothetical protein SAMD00023353_3601010 [Rosellinia necatrix]